MKFSKSIFGYVVVVLAVQGLTPSVVMAEDSKTITITCPSGGDFKDDGTYAITSVNSQQVKWQSVGIMGPDSKFDFNGYNVVEIFSGDSDTKVKCTFMPKNNGGEHYFIADLSNIGLKVLPKQDSYCNKNSPCSLTFTIP